MEVFVGHVLHVWLHSAQLIEPSWQTHPLRVPTKGSPKIALVHSMDCITLIGAAQFKCAPYVTVPLVQMQVPHSPEHSLVLIQGHATSDTHADVREALDRCVTRHERMTKTAQLCAAQAVELPIVPVAAGRDRPLPTLETRPVARCGPVAVAVKTAL